LKSKIGFKWVFEIADESRPMIVPVVNGAFSADIFIELLVGGRGRIFP
jgi:hypothetical protein